MLLRMDIYGRGEERGTGIGTLRRAVRPAERKWISNTQPERWEEKIRVHQEWEISQLSPIKDFG